jgi:hypothetical protein
VLLIQHLKWGERPEGEPAARGAWANSRGMLLGRNYRDRSPGPIKLKKTSTANTEMQTAVIIAVLAHSEEFQPRDHSACKPRPRKWPKGYIRIGTLVRYVQAMSK